LLTFCDNASANSRSRAATRFRSNSTVDPADDNSPNSLPIARNSRDAAARPDADAVASPGTFASASRCASNATRRSDEISRSTSGSTRFEGICTSEETA
jgi:hypothetical protein